MRDAVAARPAQPTGMQVVETPTLPSPAPQPPPDLPDTDDMALLVRAAAVAKIKAGELRISTQDGLAAQALIDKREEKRKDREVIVQIGRLLAQGAAPPPMVTEGEYTELDINEEAQEEPLLIGG